MVKKNITVVSLRKERGKKLKRRKKFRGKKGTCTPFLLQTIILGRPASTLETTSICFGEEGDGSNNPLQRGGAFCGKKGKSIFYCPCNLRTSFFKKKQREDPCEKKKEICSLVGEEKRPGGFTKKRRGSITRKELCPPDFRSSLFEKRQEKP